MRKAMIVLAASLLAGVVLGADGPPAKPGDTKPGKPISAAGVVTDARADSAMVWIDGDEAPTKFGFAESFDKTTFGFPPKCKGVFVPDRVTFTYSKGDDGNKLLTMNLSWPLAKPPAGKVTGEVKFKSADNFWIMVKPTNGPPDGYAVGWPPGPVHEFLKTVKAGDWVTLKFHTDIERHRIDAIQMAAKPLPPPEKPAPTVKSATSRPETPATTQPSVTDPAAAKLRLVQSYLDAEMKDKAKELLGQIVREYPNTDAAKQAQAKLKELGN